MDQRDEFNLSHLSSSNEDVENDGPTDEKTSVPAATTVTRRARKQLPSKKFYVDLNEIVESEDDETIDAVKGVDKLLLPDNSHRTSQQRAELTRPPSTVSYKKQLSMLIREFNFFIISSTS